MILSRLLWWRREGSALYQRDVQITEALDNALESLIGVLAERERRRKSRRRREKVVPIDRRSGADRRRRCQA